MEAAILAQSCGAEQAVLNELVASERPAYALALRLVGSPEDAEDIVQQAYLKACGSLRGEPPPHEARAWFLTVVANAAKNHLRDSERRAAREAAMRTMAGVERKTAGDSSPTDGNELVAAPLDVAQGRELVARLRSALDGLEPENRALVTLCCEQGLSQREAARILELPLSTLSDRLGRILDELRTALGRAGFTAGSAAVIAGLKSTAPAVPASLTAFIGNLTAGNLGKAAAGVALKISARLGAKKAVGLALGWKVGAVVTAAAIGAATVVGVRSGMFRERPPVPAVAAPAASGILPRPSGPVIFEDDFDSPPVNWEMVIGNPEKGFEAVTERPERYWRTLKSQEGYKGQFRISMDRSLTPPLKDISMLIVGNPDYQAARYQEYKDRFVGIRSLRPMEAERFAVEARVCFHSPARHWMPPIEMIEADLQPIDKAKLGPPYPVQRFCLSRWELEPAEPAPKKGVFLCRRFLDGEFQELLRVTTKSGRILLCYSGADMCIDRVTVYGLLQRSGASVAGGSGQGEEGAP